MERNLHNYHLLNPADIPESLLEKYQQSGPRYTSYPTAPQFTDSFDKQEILNRWGQTNAGANGLSLYTHFPFCRTRCLFCGCHTLIGKAGKKQEDYIEALKREVTEVFKTIDPTREMHQVAFGGGTPTYFFRRPTGKLRSPSPRNRCFR